MGLGNCGYWACVSKNNNKGNYEKAEKYQKQQKVYCVYLICLPKRVAEGCIYFLAGAAVIAHNVETSRARITPSCSKSKNGEYLKRYNPKRWN